MQHNCKENINLLVTMAVATANQQVQPNVFITGPGFFSPIPRSSTRMSSVSPGSCYTRSTIDQSLSSFSTPSSGSSVYSQYQSNPCSSLNSNNSNPAAFSRPESRCVSRCSDYSAYSNGSESVTSFQTYDPLPDLSPMLAESPLSPGPSYPQTPSTTQHNPLHASTPLNTENLICKYLVPEELKNLIKMCNPQQNIEFVLSQRQNTQMILNNFLLRKRKGPMNQFRGRTIHWTCSQEGCSFTCTSVEGRLTNSRYTHNHTPQREQVRKRLAARSQVKFEASFL